jgi:uncharacterized membrane protein
MSTQYPPAADPESGESAYDRLERRWNEQLSELRVTQSGTQIMTGFLLTLTFQPSFAEIDPVERILYLALVITATLATVMAIAPVSFHRILFGHPGAKARIVGITQVLIRVTLTLVAFVLSGTIALIFNVVVGGLAGLIGFIASLAIITSIWVALPLQVLATLNRNSRR